MQSVLGSVSETPSGLSECQCLLAGCFPVTSLSSCRCSLCLIPKLSLEHWSSWAVLVAAAPGAVLRLGLVYKLSEERQA